MEENIFSSFSFTSPSKSRSRGAGKLNMCNLTTDVPSASSLPRPQRDFRDKQVKGEAFDCNSKLRSNSAKESRLSSLLEANGKTSVLGKLSPKFRKDDFPTFEDIEDCIPGSKTFSPLPLEKKTSVLGKNKGMSTTTPSTAAPPDWERIVEEIRTMRIKRDAPVDLLGPQQLFDRSKDAETQKFHILVAAMLSSQTRDAITAAAMNRLHALPGGFTAQRVAEEDLSVETLEQLLKPVGFYRQKAKHLKAIATMLMKSPYCGSVPSTLSELMKFPGVGPKIGLVILWVAFGKSEDGFICDSNVARVCCRLGWVPENSTPDETRQALEMWLPKYIWADLSYLFVGFGQQICKPVGPLCKTCEVSSLCPSAFKCRTKKPKKETMNSHLSSARIGQIHENK